MFLDSLTTSKKIILFFLLVSITLVTLYLFTRPQTIQTHIVDRETFQAAMKTWVVPLPSNMVALGFHGPQIYIYHSQDFEHEGKLKNTLDFWTTYIHPYLTKQIYTVVLNTYDGYGERIPYHKGPLTYKQFPEDTFTHAEEMKTSDPSTFPLLHRDKIVLAYAKKLNDKHTMLMPDLFFLHQHGYQKTLIPEIDSARIPWHEKKSACVWRGNPTNGTSCNIPGRDCGEPLNQRQLFVQQYKQGSFISMNYDDSSLTKAQQLQYKYILDIDGWSNTWDGTFWKLYSGSVMLKCDGVWTQWYYDELEPYVHYIPIAADCSDLSEKIGWCKTHDEECQQIAKNAYEFVKRKLTWSQAIQDTIEEANRRL